MHGWWRVLHPHDDENSADVMLSTAHEAKGREWNSVRLAAGFANSRANADQADVEAEAHLCEP